MKTVRRILSLFRTGRNIFDLRATPIEMEPVDLPKTTEEAWLKDWQNIGGDFRRAYTRFNREYSQKIAHA